MAKLDEVGTTDGWRCWLCDEPVDPDMSVNDPRGPSIDLRTTRAKAKKTKAKRAGTTGKGGDVRERLAHRGCNTGKGATEAVVPWPEDLFVVEPAPIIAAVDRLGRKGGREIMARCPTVDDAEAAAEWLADRVSRLEPELDATSEIESGGGQYLVVLRA